MTRQRTFLAGLEQGCPAAACWDAYWTEITLPLAGRDLYDATQTLAGWNDPDSPHGDLGDCPHCAEQVARLTRLVVEATGQPPGEVGWS